MSDLELVLRLFLQLSVILLACRVLGYVGRFFGQTQVVSEMVAGVALGPSILGAILPAAQQWLFPQIAVIAVDGVELTIRHPSMSILYVISQLGLVLYMFLVGLEFNTTLMRGKLKAAAYVSSAGILLPFTLGAVAAMMMFDDFPFFREGVSLWAGALFMGASMCITAFPMLARILYERGIAQTGMGTLALASGASNDVVAWVMLAIVVSAVAGSMTYAALAIGGGLLFAILMLTLGKRAFAIFGRLVERDGGVTLPTMISILLVLMLSAWYTDRIGIYAVFGAFVVGVAMPRGKIVEELRRNMLLLTTGLLLPVFFVYSGLNTHIGLLDSPALWIAAAILVAVAIIGKGVGCMLAARMSGEGWRESAAIGSLMNARGLMELIILNIGLERGIITPTLFTILVIMAIVTTLMASPLLMAVYGRHHRVMSAAK